jgi:hypothetical protein
MSINAVSVCRMVLTGSLLVACQHQATPATSAAQPLSSRNREFCWWAPLGTMSSPDSTAGRFRRAYAELKLANVSMGKRGDTAWAHAGPSALPTRTTNALYESGALAYPERDSTKFRYFVAISAPPGGWNHSSDSVSANAGDLDLCADIARRAAIKWNAPKAPTGEESMPLWNASPWNDDSRDSTPHE